uniref:PHR domain-containing protein n=1 Tax=Angiostrongylus cantonensis TaxID=6313 RepID=A0A158PC95_ANGCA
MAALAVCSGLPDHLMEAIEALICTERNDPQNFDSSCDELQVPENLHRLSVVIQHKACKGSEAERASWFEKSLDEHKVLCTFDLPSLQPDSFSETPDDDMRLQSSIACDGAYIYLLNYIGFYKIGSGLQETVLGKLYSSNNSIKATSLEVLCPLLQHKLSTNLLQWVSISTKRTIVMRISHRCGLIKGHWGDQTADFHIGRDISFLQSKSGKIYYAGNGINYGLQETGTTWMELVLPENIVEMSVGAEYALFRAGSGHAWIACGDDGRRAGKLRRRKTQSISCAAGSYGYVTDNGRVYVGGRHGMSVYPETGQILGLDGTHISSIVLGKTHAVAVSKQGYVYTWGLNNLNQCGRVEDLPSYCAQCGLCSARGSACPLQDFSGKTVTCSCGPGETTCLRCGVCRTCGESTQPRPDGDQPARSYLTPARVNIVKAQQNVKVYLKILHSTSLCCQVSSVSCGNFHTVLLAADGSVFSFGSNCHGQLGTGDINSKIEPQLVSSISIFFKVVSFHLFCFVSKNLC